MSTTILQHGNVRYVRRYSVNGNGFIHCESDAGGRVDVKVQDGDNLELLTRREAKYAAMRHLGIGVPCPNGCGGLVLAGVYIDQTLACPSPDEFP